MFFSPTFLNRSNLSTVIVYKRIFFKNAANPSTQTRKRAALEPTAQLNLELPDD